MRQALELLVNYFFSAREFFDNAIGPILPWLKFISLIISGLLLWGIIYAISGSNYINYKTERWLDALGSGGVGKRRQLRAWRQIIQQLKSKEMIGWKSAIIKADMIFDEILKMSGYRGATVHDRFKQLPPTAISNHDKILAAHKIRDRIIQESDFGISKEETIAIINIYEQAFKEFGLLD